MINSNTIINIDVLDGFKQLEDKSINHILTSPPYSFGWNSQGFGKVRGFEIVEIMLVPHGGAHNDTIVVVETKVSEAEALRAPPNPKGSGIRAGERL